MIVTADDLGRTAGINHGVVEAHRQGIVTSASLMVTGRTAVEAACLARELPALGVGLHLVLSNGLPVSPKVASPSLVDEDRFPPSPDNLALARPHEVLTEIQAQFQRFLELMGRPPTHIDTHHHAHRVQVVFEALVIVGREHGVAIRSISPAMRERLRQESLATTDEFIDAFHGEHVSVPLLVKLLSELRVGVTELMSHPGRLDEELRQESRYAEGRERELDVLTDPCLRDALETHGVSLIHYGMLLASGAG